MRRCRPPPRALFVVNLPTRFDNEQENHSGDADDHAERYQKCFHDLSSWSGHDPSHITKVWADPKRPQSQRQIDLKG
jgi:hypothetical protein